MRFESKLKNNWAITFSICILISIILSNCSTTSQLYLQSARYTDDVTYGYVKSNPIMLKCYEKIIEEYISRLFTENLDSFTITEKNTISIQTPSTTQIEKEFANSNCPKSVDSLECYKILSEDGKQSYILYFKLIKNKKKLYVPFGLGFGYLSD